MLCFLFSKFCFFHKSTVAKGCKFYLYVFKFIGISKRNRVTNNRSILEFRRDQNNIQQQYTV